MPSTMNAMQHFNLLGAGTTSTSAFAARKTKPQPEGCCCEMNWCTVCNMRRCIPVRPSKWANGTLNTTYKRDYDEKKGLGRDPPGELQLKDKTLVASRQSFDPTTTQRADYTPKQGMPWGKRDRGGPMSYRPFDDRTTYNTYHHGKQGPKSEQLPQQWDNYSAPFHGLSTKQADYIDWGDARRVGNPPVSVMPQQQFQGTTTYKDDYIKKQMPPKERRAPPPLLPSNNQDNYTTYGTDYEPKPIHKSKAMCCDHPRHPTTHLHLPPASRSPASELYGTATGRLYRVRQ